MLEAALSELLRAHTLISSGETYVLANRVWRAALIARLDADQVCARHRALARFYEERSKPRISITCSLLVCTNKAWSAMIAQYLSYEQVVDFRREANPGKLAWCCALAISTARPLQRSPRQIHDLRRWHLAGSISDEHGEWDESARLWFEQLAHDAGLDLYRLDGDTQDSHARLMRALQAAHQRFLATPEHERVCQSTKPFACWLSTSSSALPWVDARTTQRSCNRCHPFSSRLRRWHPRST